MRTKWSYFVTILIHGLLANAQSNCDSPWNITIDGDHLQWTGEDREADVVILLEPDTFNGTGEACSNLTLNVPFSDREAFIESQCANTFHLANATIACDDSPPNKMEDFQLLEEDPRVPVNISVVKVTNKSITLKWLEPTSSDSIVGYKLRKSTVKGSFLEDVDQTSDTMYELGGLKPYTDYYIQVSATYENDIKDYWSKSVIVRTKPAIPSTPTGIAKQSSTNSSILVIWKEPNPSNGPILKYTIKWVKDGGLNPAERDSNKTFCLLDDLSAFTNYTVQVRATTEAGSGPWSKAKILSTDIGVPTVPRNVSVTNTSSTSISLSWEAPDPENGPILNYKVFWGLSESVLSEVSVAETWYEYKSLNPYTEYWFQVAAVTKAGLGPYSERLYKWTDIDLPSQPGNLTNFEVTNTSILIQWDVPEQPNGPLLPYVVKVLECNNNNNKTMEMESNFANYTVEGLFPYVNYSVQVCAQTKAGRGEWTEELDFRTEIGIPSAPKHLSAPEVLPTQIHLNWSIPESPAGPFVDYLVQWGVKGTAASLFVTPETTYEAIGLRPYTEYFFGVAARTEAGVGNSEVLIVYTDVAAPSAPGDISVLETTESSISLSWATPQHPNGPSLLYLVQWGQISENGTSIGNTTSTQFLIENLNPSANYSVRIAAQTSVGLGPWTELVYIETNRKGPSLNLILGLSLGLALPLVIILIVGVVIAYRKGGLKCLSSISSAKTETKEPSPYQYDNPPTQMGVYHLKPKSLNVQNFEERLNRPMYSSRIEMVKEFGDLKESSPQHSCNVAKLEENLPKNRWGKMLPYDHSRVKLFPYGDKLKPDFINANYIPGDSYLLEYIASQGPLKETLDDFWTMIWQQSVTVIVMLTQCVEKAVRNCEQYWPASGQSKIFGEVQVYAQSESVLTSYVVRVLAVQCRSEKRIVIHMHFSNWPVSGCPRTPDEFLHFSRKVREQVSDCRPGPMLVHCSAGVGRTGTFIAVDRIFQHLGRSDDIDIYGTVLDMRRYRPHMVHTEDQYTFIYSCVKRYLQEKKEPQESLYEVAL